MRRIWWIFPFIMCLVGLLIPYSFIHLTKVAYIAPSIIGLVGGAFSFYRIRRQNRDDAEFVFWVSLWFALAMLILSVNLFG